MPLSPPQPAPIVAPALSLVRSRTSGAHAVALHPEYTAPTELRPTPPRPARVITYPDGVTAPILARNVYRQRSFCGDYYCVYAVDSTGNCRNIVEQVPCTATRAEFMAAIDRCWERLNTCDPLPEPAIIGDLDDML